MSARRIWAAGGLPVLVVLLVVAACSGGPGSSGSSGPGGSSGSSGAGTLTVFAASSLTAAFRDVAAAYQSKTGVAMTLSYDASSTLRTQIEQGAPADILASADATNPDQLLRDGFAAGAPVAFAGNRLTVVVPAAGTAAVSSPLDLAKPGVRIVAAGDAVPVAKYANQVVANLATQTGYPADYVARVTANVVSKEDNVKAVVAKIELGEGDAAIVYVTDARASTRVRAIDVPAAANVPAVYEAVGVKASRQRAAAAAFLAWLTAPEAQAILATYGFLPPG